MEKNEEKGNCVRHRSQVYLPEGIHGKDCLPHNNGGEVGRGMRSERHYIEGMKRSQNVLFPHVYDVPPPHDSVETPYVSIISGSAE